VTTTPDGLTRIHKDEPQHVKPEGKGKLTPIHDKLKQNNSDNPIAPNNPKKDNISDNPLENQ
jgi:hypothetical protein